MGLRPLGTVPWRTPKTSPLRICDIPSNLVVLRQRVDHDRFLSSETGLVLILTVSEHTASVYTISVCVGDGRLQGTDERRWPTARGRRPRSFCRTRRPSRCTAWFPTPSTSSSFSRGAAVPRIVRTTNSSANRSPCRHAVRVNALWLQLYDST